jgi:hypothetical protein
MFAALVLALAQSIEWTRVDIDAKFRSEDVAVGDFNHDGVLDIANGEAWYEAPTWKPHALRPDGMKEFDPATQYSRCFALWAWDINRDSWPDLICVDFPGTPCYWLENPAGKDEPWKQYEVFRDACNESPVFTRVRGGLQPVLVLGSERFGTLGTIAIPEAEQVHQPWPFQPLGESGAGGGYARFDHGLGVGGARSRLTEELIVTPRGAWMYLIGTDRSAWRWVPFVLGVDEKTPDDGAQMFVDDFDDDGDLDIAMSSAHAVGVWWYERDGTLSKPTFTRHTIDESFSQSHALRYADIDGDGERDLITGKRWYAHGPDGDVDAKAEPVVVWYQVKKGSKSAPKFTRHEIEVARGTGIGTQFQVIDVDGDQRADIVLSNKRGTHLLLQRAPEAKK